MAYANKYYDPVKAHEYYEKNKKLKGRHSTKGMTNTQKEMAAYVKDKLNTEKKQKIQNVTDQSKSQKVNVSDAAKRKRESFTKSCSYIISNLRAKLQNMSAEEKKFAKTRIQKEISKIRETFAQRKADVSAAAKNQKSGISAAAKTEKENIRTDYSNKYADALQNIRDSVK